MSRKVLVMLCEWTHETAATLVGDVERPRILQQPGSKRAAGRLVILGMGVVIALLLATWSSVQQPPIRTTRHWLSVQPLKEQVGFMNDSANKLAEGTMLCPCLNSYRQQPTPYRHRHFFLFYLITPDPKIQGAYIREPDTQWEDEMDLGTSSGAAPFPPNLCTNVLPLNSPYVNLTNNFCFSLAEPIASYLALHSNDDAWLNPIRFLNRACRELGDTIIKPKTGKTNESSTTSDKLSEYVALLWQNVFDVGASWSGWPPPTDADFWSQRLQSGLALQRFNESVNLNVSVNRSVAFAVVVNWTVYYEFCSPSYCDEVLQTSLAWRVYAGVAQVGGFLSLALVLLQTLVWPIIQALFGWRGEPTGCLTIYPDNTMLPKSAGQLPHPPQDTSGSQNNNHLSHSDSWR